MSIEDLRRAAERLATAARIPPTEAAPQLPVTGLVASIQEELLAQPWLREVYPGLSVTGILDGATKAALTEFQERAAQFGAQLTAIPLSLPQPQAQMSAQWQLPPVRAAARQPRGWLAAVISLVGMLITVLTLITGLGILSPDARDAIAVVLAVLTPIAVFYAPTKGVSDAVTTEPPPAGP